MGIKLSKMAAVVVVLFAVGVQGAEPASRPAIRVPHAGLRKMTWQMAIPTQTFTDLTVFESIDLLHELDFHHLEISDGNKKLGVGNTEVNAWMKPEEIEALMAKLKAVKMDIVSYKVEDYGGMEGAPAHFKFAKAIKAKTIIFRVTPGKSDLPALGKMAEEYGVTLAVAPRLIGDGREVERLQQTLKGVGAKGAVYLEAQEVKKVAEVGVPEFVNAIGEKFIDVQFGDVSGAKETLAALKGKGFKGIVTVTHEPGPKEKILNSFIELVNGVGDAVTEAAK